MMRMTSAKLFLVALFPAFTAISAQAQQVSATAERPHAPTGYLLIEEERWNALADEPSRHLGRARDALLMMDGRNAATEIRKAEVHLRIAADHTTEVSKRALLRAEHELEQVARRIETGTQTSIEDFDIVVARALHALSHDQYAKAAQAWRKHEIQRAGQYLRASEDNLERAAARLDSGMRHATAIAVKDSRLISAKLIEGTGIVADEIGGGFESLGTAIERFGARIEGPARK